MSSLVMSAMQGVALARQAHRGDGRVEGPLCGNSTRHGAGVPFERHAVAGLGGHASGPGYDHVMRSARDVWGDMYVLSSKRLQCDDVNRMQIS